MNRKGPESAQSPGDPPKDASTPLNTQVEIGNSFYSFSKETQKYLQVDHVSQFENTKRILIIGEPHDMAEAQYSLFKGLEIFFRDNPELVNQTIFLAEGFPINEPISIQELIKEDPTPTDDLIRKVLGSFLITGYMAYEWKHQQGIPIIGTEDKELYDMSRTFYEIGAKNPTRAFTKISTITSEGEMITEVPISAAWVYAVVGRNRSITNTLLEQAKRYLNPVLFVGSGHLLRQNTEDFDYLKDLADNSGIMGPFHQFAYVARGVENKGIYSYLEEAKIGFTLIMPVGTEQDENTSNYNKLFDIQHKAYLKGDETTDYQQYIEQFLSQRGLHHQGTTVRPAPEAAAELVRKLKEKQLGEEKSGVVYEMGQQNGDAANWFQVSRDEIQAKLGKDTIWDESPATRGRSYEQLRAVNLGGNYKIVDDIHVYEKVATSMKTLNTTDSTYWENPSVIESVGKGYVDKFEDFSGVTYPDGFHIAREEFEHFHLEIAVPYGKLSAGQRDALHRVQEYGREKGILVIITEVV